MGEPVVVDAADLRAAVQHLRHRSPCPDGILERLTAAVTQYDTPDLFAPAPEPATDVAEPGLPRMRTTSSPTARKMRAKVWPGSGTYRLEMLRTVAINPAGMTDYELEKVMGRTHQSVSATRNNLVADGWLEPATRADGSPIERDNQFQNPCQVWRPTDAAHRRLRTSPVGGQPVEDHA